MAALAETGIAIQNGVTWVRTHDVLETKQFISVLEEVM
jgi:dihydropteroate synthase